MGTKRTQEGRQSSPPWNPSSRGRAWLYTWWYPTTNHQLLPKVLDPTLICLLSCVGNFSSSTSLTAALPRNKSMVIPGGSNPWCCCHFNACEKGRINLLRSFEEPVITAQAKPRLKERGLGDEYALRHTILNHPTQSTVQCRQEHVLMGDSDRKNYYLTPLFH